MSELDNYLKACKDFLEDYQKNKRTTLSITTESEVIELQPEKAEGFCLGFLLANSIINREEILKRLAKD